MKRSRRHSDSGSTLTNFAKARRLISKLCQALAISTLVTLSTSGSTHWIPPTDGKLNIQAPFDLPRGKFEAGHRGIDLRATEGQTIRAPSAGVVSFAGLVAGRRVLSLRIDERTVVSFEPLTSELTTGSYVSTGDSLGHVATGGHCHGECLHLGVRVDGEYVNPLRYFWRKPVLLPW